MIAFGVIWPHLNSWSEQLERGTTDSEALSIDLTSNATDVSASPSRRIMALSSFEDFGSVSHSRSAKVILVSLAGSSSASQGHFDPSKFINSLLSEVGTAVYLFGNSKALCQNAVNEAFWGPILEHLKNQGKLSDGIAAPCMLHEDGLLIYFVEQSFGIECCCTTYTNVLIVLVLWLCLFTFDLNS